MIISLYQWFKKNIILFANAGSLVGATGVTSLLGFAYWWLAARQFPLDAVGLASASVSAMTLLGTFCMLGLGTLLITELPRQPDKAASLISTALILVGGVGTIAGLAFALAAPYMSVNFQPLRANLVNVLIFSSGVGLIAVSLVLDQALIGLLRAGLHLWRNSFFAISKLVLLLVAGLWLSQKTGIAIYFTWTIGIGLSLIVLLKYIPLKEKRSVTAFLPQWGLVRKLGLAALQHHMLNMTLQVPTLMLPVLVTTLLSTKMNAWFYVSWMIASFIFIIPSSLTTVLHAMSSAQPASLTHKVRLTMGIAIATSTLANLPLQFATTQVLGLFGHSYADQAAWCLRILALCSFPLIIRFHYMSICRIQDRIKPAMLSMAPGGLLELVAASLGAHFAGLAGLALGWLFAICIEALFMSRTIYQTLISPQILPQHSNKDDYLVIEPVWQIDTTPVPVVSGSFGKLDLGYLETFKLPSIKSVGKVRLKLVKRPVLREIITSPSRSNLRLKPLRLQPYTLHPDYMDATEVPTIGQIMPSNSSNISVKDREM